MMAFARVTAARLKGARTMAYKITEYTYKPITNADRIRGMNDEELAEFIDEISGFQADYLQYRGEFIDAGDVLAWLRQSAEEEYI